MSNEKQPTRSLGNYDENNFEAKQKEWAYSDQPASIQQNRRCCSPSADEIEIMGEEDTKYSTHSVEVQTEKSVIFNLKQDKKLDRSTKTSVSPNASSRNFQDTRKMFSSPNYGHDKIAERLARVNLPNVYDDFAETDTEQPMDYTLCYNENNVEEEKKRSAFHPNKSDFLCTEKTAEKEKMELTKSKGAYSKESKNKKEMFTNPSRSFKEIFNFFKDRDKKRSIDNSKVPAPEVLKFVKPLETYKYEYKDKLQQSPQSFVDQSEKEVKSKNDLQYSQSQQTPLTFSRCSSLSSLSGFEQASINDDRNSVVSDFSRRTSGVVSPSELPDSPAHSAPSGLKTQQKTPVNCHGIKKTLFPQQDKFKVGQLPVASNENSFQNDGYYRKSTAVKSSIFEDSLTSFKDESTPVLHSMAASSLSSLTIDDDDDYDLMNKIIINREKQTVSEEDTDDSSRKDPLGKSNDQTDSSRKPEIHDNLSKLQEENFSKEEEELAPFEEQLLDQCVRTGIAKWTKQNVNEIKPFSWDVGLICRSTRVMLTNTILEESETDFQIDSSQNSCANKVQTNTSQNLNREIKKNNSENYSSASSEPTESVSNFNEENDLFYGNHNNTTYEEHLLDQCIRRGISKITRKNINLIRPFSWDVNQICLTTRAMMLRNRDDINFKGH